MSVKLNKDNMTGELKLSSGHSIILGHKPAKIKSEDLSNQLQSENNCTQVESFGLWEVATPNYATYYPDVTAEDLTPKEEEFITPVFRMLSEVVVSKGWRPIDFSKKGVLKKSMQMLVGQTINIDHEIAVGNAIGAVSEVYWQNAYKTKSGIEVPAGINAVLKIDGKSNPRIARGITMEPPSIHSNSVTVRFKWEPSHTMEDMNQFYNLLGTYDADGNMYRLVVTEIMSYSETSLVSHGADPYAQKIKEDGEINNPEYADKQLSFSKDGNFSAAEILGFDYKSELKLAADDNSIPKRNNININNQQKSFNMDELIQSFISEFNFTAEDSLNKENLVTKLKEKFGAKDTEIQALKQKETDLETKISGLETENTSLKANNQELENVTSQTRTEAERLYKLAKDKDADENIVALLKNADLKTAASFVKQYQKEVDEKFTQSCGECGSTNISRGSAQATKEGLIVDNQEGDGNKGGKQTLTTTEVRNSLKNKKKKESVIFKK